VIAHRPGGSARERLYPVIRDDANLKIDYVAVEYAMNGEAVHLTIEERIEAARQLADRGINLTEVGRRVGRDRSMVVRWQNNGWKEPGEGSDDTEPIDIGGAEHGRSGYTKGCRCIDCRAGARDDARRRRAAKKAVAA
jgi:hypothetical protein